MLEETMLEKINLLNKDEICAKPVKNEKTRAIRFKPLSFSVINMRWHKFLVKTTEKRLERASPAF